MINRITDFKLGLIKRTAVFFLLMCMTSVTFGEEFSIGKYVGRWKDEGGFSGKFTLTIENISEQNVTGTVQITGNIPCRRHYPFETTITAESYLEISVNSQTGCGYIHYKLGLNDNEINGTFREFNYAGVIMKARFNQN